MKVYVVHVRSHDDYGSWSRVDSAWLNEVEANQRRDFINDNPDQGAETRASVEPLEAA